MEKIFNHKSFNSFVWTPLGSTVELNYRYIFAFKFTLRSQRPDIVPIFCPSVINTVSKFAAGGVDTGGKLPPVSSTLAKLVAKFVAGVVDTGGAP
jgi:hypothetical protein